MNAQQAKRQRTQDVIDHFRNLPGEFVFFACLAAFLGGYIFKTLEFVL